MIRVMDKNTGKLLEGEKAVDQCLEDIVFTMRGSEPLLRDYGVEILDEVDRVPGVGLSWKITKAVQKWLGRYIRVVRVRTGIKEGESVTEIIYRFRGEMRSLEL